MATMSVNTNAAAQSALAHFNLTANRLDQTQDRVSTGLKVIGAQDDASSFSIAQGTRGDLKAYQAVSQGLANARGVSQTALAGTDQFMELMSHLKKKIIEGMNPGNTTEQQSILNQDYSDLITHMRAVLQGASYNGVNILIEFAIPFNLFLGTANDVDITSDIDGSTIRLHGLHLDWVWANLNAENISTTAAAQQALGVWDTYFPVVTQGYGTLGADLRQLTEQDKFIDHIVDAATVGLGSTVDADIAKESARLQAQQVARELSAEVLNIANARPNIVGQLFNFGG